MEIEFMNSRTPKSNILRVDCAIELVQKHIVVMIQKK